MRRGGGEKWRNNTRKDKRRSIEKTEKERERERKRRKWKRREKGKKMRLKETR